MQKKLTFVMVAVVLAASIFHGLARPINLGTAPLKRFMKIGMKLLRVMTVVAYLSALASTASAGEPLNDLWDFEEDTFEFFEQEAMGQPVQDSRTVPSTGPLGDLDQFLSSGSSGFFTYSIEEGRFTMTGESTQAPDSFFANYSNQGNGVLFDLKDNTLAFDVLSSTTSGSVIVDFIDSSGNSSQGFFPFTPSGGSGVSA